MSVPRMTATELRDAGYLAEANRRFFHPLGLSMFVDTSTDTVGVHDDRADPEGWYFDDVAADLVAKVENVAALEDERRAPRRAALRYWIQPIAAPTGAAKVHEAISDEDGDSWYVKGHIAPEAMVLAAIVCIATEVGSSDAIDTLVGVEDETLSYVAIRDRMVRTADTLLGSVRHLWYVENGEERNPFVDPGTPGALPITVLAL